MSAEEEASKSEAADVPDIGVEAAQAATAHKRRLQVAPPNDY